MSGGWEWVSRKRDTQKEMRRNSSLGFQLAHGRRGLVLAAYNRWYFFVNHSWQFSAEGRYIEGVQLCTEDKKKGRRLGMS